jgi:hypothetical protein
VLQQQDRVRDEQDREEDRPAIEVALDQRAAAKRSRAGPTPNAPDSPESLPECIRISSTRMTQITTCSVEKSACMPSVY